MALSSLVRDDHFSKKSFLGHLIFPLAVEMLESGFLSKFFYNIIYDYIYDLLQTPYKF